MKTGPSLFHTPVPDQFLPITPSCSVSCGPNCIIKLIRFMFVYNLLNLGLPIRLTAAVLHVGYRLHIKTHPSSSFLNLGQAHRIIKDRMENGIKGSRMAKRVQSAL